jgi:hypothetical protein
MKNEKEVQTFGDLKKRMEPFQKIVQDELAKKRRLIEGLESLRNEMIQIDTDISGLQEKLNDELISKGRVSDTITNQLQTLRAKRENIEVNIISLKTGAIPKLDESIKVAEIEMGKVYELAMDELRKVYAGMIQTQFLKIEMIAEEWLNESRQADTAYGQGFGSIDRGRIKKLIGYTKNTDLLERLSGF